MSTPVLLFTVIAIVVIVMAFIGGRKNIGSFPVIQFSQRFLLVGVLWLAAVIIFWSWKYSATKDLKESPPAAPGGRG